MSAKKSPALPPKGEERGLSRNGSPQGCSRAMSGLSGAQSMVSAMVKQADDAEFGAAAPWPPDWDEIVLRLLASGLVELADRVETGQPVRLPYPVSLQRGLDRMSVMCLAAGESPPRSVADLLRWSQLAPATPTPTAWRLVPCTLDRPESVGDRE
jgi:hypothetical protein